MGRLSLHLLAAAAAVLHACSGGPAGDDLRARSAERMTATTASPEALVLLRAAQEAFDNFREAESLSKLEQAVALDPNFVLAHAYLGATRAGPAALEELQRAVALSPTLPLPERLLVQQLLAGRMGAADTQRKLSRRIAELLPGDFRAQISSAEAELAADNWSAAVEAYARATALEPKAGFAWGAYGTALAYQGDAQAARAAAEHYRDLSPSEPNAWDTLGEVSLLSGDTAPAEAAFIRSVELQPSFWISWQGLAFARLYRGDWKGADAALDEAGKVIRPYEAGVQRNNVRAWFALIHGDEKTALRYAAEVEAAWRKAGDPLSEAYAPLPRAGILLAAGRPAEALEAVSQARRHIDEHRLNRGERNVARWLGLGLKIGAEAALGRVADAEATLATIELEQHRSPANPRLRDLGHYGRGLLHQLRGDFAGAVQELGGCSPELPSCRHDLWQAQLRLKDFAAAEHTRRQLLSLRRLTPQAAWVWSRAAAAGGGIAPSL